MSLTGSRFSSESALSPSSMGFEDEADQSNKRSCREMVGRSKRTHDLTSSIVPRGTSFHRAVEFECSPIASARLSCCCCPGPAELGAVNPYAMHHDRHTAGHGDDSAPHSPMACDLHAPALEP